MEGGKIDQREEEEIRMGNKRGRDEKGNMGRLEKKPSGMVVVEEYSGDEMINGVKYEEEKVTADAGGGGLFNQLITNLVNSPKSNPTHDHVSDVESKKNGDDREGGGGGGVINNLISNISSSGNGNGREVAVEKDDGDGDGDGEKEKDGGRNTIDNIVSQLPRTLSEDAAPATDEASILLHSIIHD